MSKLNEIESAFGYTQEAAPVRSVEFPPADSNALEKPVTDAARSATANASEANLPNRLAIMERMGNDTALLGELVGMFNSHVPKLLSDVSDSIFRRNGKELERAAHSLKGAVGNFDVGEAYKAALCLERIGRSGNLEEAPVTYLVLEKALKDLRLQLASLMEEMA